jgi:hypothetical protein
VHVKVLLFDVVSGALRFTNRKKLSLNNWAFLIPFLKGKRILIQYWFKASRVRVYKKAQLLSWAFLFSIL